MSLDFTNVTSVTIPEGDVTQIAIDGSTVWKRQPPAGYWEVTRSDGIAPTAGTAWAVRLSDGATGYYAFATETFTAVSFAVGDVVGHDDIMFSVDVSVASGAMSQYVSLNGGTYKCVNWGDGTVSAVATGALTVNHTYASIGTYTVKAYAVEPTGIKYFEFGYINNRVSKINNSVPWNSLQTVEKCFRASRISSIPADIFAACTGINRFTTCFYSCDRVTGVLPALWESHASAVHAQCFTGCTQTTNYSEAQQAGWA